MLKRKILSTGVCLALGVGATLSLPAASAVNSATGTTSATQFAMNASGYGTRVQGGNLPAGSDRTAFQIIACTNTAGLDKANEEAGVSLGSLLTASVVKTRVWTTQRNGVVSSWANNNIAQATIGEGAATTVRINAINSRSRAFHDSSGFHASTQTTVGSISVDADGTGAGPAVGLRVPTQGNPTEIAGLLRISLGPKTTRVDGSSASSQGDALRVDLLLTDTTVYLAHSRASIRSGVASGLFRGNSYGSKVNGLDGTVRSGRTPYLVMPCQGTDGKVVRQDVARINPNGLVIQGLSASQQGTQSVSRADAFEQGRVERLNVGNGTIVVNGVVGRANIHFVRGQGIKTDIKGSSLGVISINGDRRSFLPGSDVLQVPGLVKLERNVITRTNSSISVTALRLTLLDGRALVIDLGHAQVGFNRSGL